MDTRSTISCKILYIYWRCACVLLVASGLDLGFRRPSITLAQDVAGSAEKRSQVVAIRSFYPQGAPIHAISGLAYAAEFNQFYLIQPDATGSQITLMTLSPYEDVLATTTLTDLEHANATLLFDADGRQLLLYSSETGDTLQIRVNQQGAPDAEHLQRGLATPMMGGEAQGQVLSSTRKGLFILDKQRRQIIQLYGSTDNRFVGAANRLDLSQFGQDDLRAVAFQPQNQQLYLLNQSAQKPLPIDNQRPDQRCV